MADLISVSYAKLHNGLSGVDTTLLSSLITAASEYIEKYCARSFSEVSTTEYYDGYDSEVLFVRHVPISAVTAIEIKEDGEFIAYDPSLLTIDTRLGRIINDNTEFTGVFSSGYQNIKITYTHGFNEVPNPVMEACSILVYHYYSNLSLGNKHNPGMASESSGGYSWSPKDLSAIGMPDTVRQLLSVYRDINVS